jgi:hypothetical protein
MSTYMHVELQILVESECHLHAVAAFTAEKQVTSRHNKGIYVDIKGVVQN